MQRKIKFRAWDKNNNKIIFNPKFLIIENDYYTVATLDCCIKCEKNMVFSSACEHLQYDVDDYLDGGLYDYPAILMQYTGLKDKNGKEIYEGDIVEFKIDEIMQVSIGGYFETVGGNGFGVHIHNKEETRVFGVSPFNQDNSLKIIGNIYENPELLTNN